MSVLTKLEATYQSYRGTLKSRPGYSSVVILLMTIAIAINGITFAVFYAYKLQSMPYPEASRLVWVREILPALGLLGYDSSPHILRQILRYPNNGILESGMISLDSGWALIRVDGIEQNALICPVSPSIFTTLGETPQLGRSLSSASGREGGPFEAIISYGFWQRAFGGKPDTLGAEIDLHHHRYEVVGVLPERRTLPSAWADIYVPMRQPLSQRLLRNINDLIIVRLQPHASLNHFNAILDNITAANIAKIPPRFRYQVKDARLKAVSLHNAYLHRKEVAALPWMFLAIGLFLWLLTVTNLSNYALVRHLDRLPGQAVRLVLGATRRRLSVLLLREQIPIIVIAYVLAIPFTLMGLKWFTGVKFFSTALLPISLNGTVLVWMLLLAIVGGVVPVLVPMIQLHVSQIMAALAEGQRSTFSRWTRFFLRGLSILQVALAVGLVTGALIFAASLYAALHRPLGFDLQYRWVAHISLPPNTPLKTAWTQILQRLDAQPYVKASAFAFTLPWTGDKSGGTVTAPTSGYVNLDWVSSRFFRTLHISLVRGSNFDEENDTRGSFNIVVGRGVCKDLFPNAHCVGNDIKLGGASLHIIGEVNSVSWQLQPWRHTVGTIYSPMKGKFEPRSDSKVIVVHLKNSASGYTKAIRQNIEATIPGAMVTRMESYAHIINKGAAYTHALTAILEILAVVEIIITLIGIYTVQSYINTVNRRAYGIRAVIGARVKDFRRLALRETAWIIIPGSVVGLGLAFLLVLVLEGFFYHAFSVALYVAPISTIMVTIITGIAVWWPLRKLALSSPSQLISMV